MGAPADWMPLYRPTRRASWAGEFEMAPMSLRGERRRRVRASQHGLSRRRGTQACSVDGPVDVVLCDGVECALEKVQRRKAAVGRVVDVDARNRGAFGRAVIGTARGAETASRDCRCIFSCGSKTNRCLWNEAPQMAMWKASRKPSPTHARFLRRNCSRSMRTPKMPAPNICASPRRAPGWSQRVVTFERARRARRAASSLQNKSEFSERARSVPRAPL